MRPSKLDRFLKTSMKSAEVAIYFTEPVIEPIYIGEVASECAICKNWIRVKKGK